MTNYWIFVVTDSNIGNKQMMAKDTFDQCIKDQFWGIGKKTANRKRLKKGDIVVFYLGGREGQMFLGNCRLDSKPVLVSKLDKKERRRLNRPRPFFSAEYGVYLTDIEVWPSPRPIQDLVSDLEFIRDKDRYWVHLQGGVRAISEDDYRIIVSPFERGREEEIEDEVEFALEKYLKEFIISNWKSIDFGANLELFRDKDGNTGENYPTSVGYPDLLCIDSDTRDFVVIELKKGRTSDKVVGQTLRYIGWVEQNLANKGQNVRGIIIAKEPDEKLTYAISPLKDKIRVKYYKVNFKLIGEK
jgi:predicted RNA-binding protein